MVVVPSWGTMLTIDVMQTALGKVAQLSTLIL